MNKYLAIETTDEKTYKEIIELVREKLGKGVNAILIMRSWKALIDELKESYDEEVSLG